MKPKAVAWLTDLIRVFFLDRFNPRYRTYSLQASTAARSCHFHAHAPIGEKSLSELVNQIAPKPISQIVLPGPDTQLGDVGSHSYYYTLASLIAALQPRTVLEIGTYLGVGSYVMALNAPSNCHLYTVDLPDGAQPEADHDLNRIDERHIVQSRGRVGQAFLGTPQEKRITQIRADSLKLRIEDHLTQADFILVDGGHSLPIVTKDTENALRILAPKGLLLWDDYFHLYPDVVTYLNDLARKLPLWRIRGTNFVCYQHES